MIASFTLVLLLNILVKGASSCLFKPHSDIKARHQELEDQTVARTVARIEGHAHGFIHNLLNGISASRDAELQEKINSLDDFYQDEILKRELLLNQTIEKNARRFRELLVENGSDHTRIHSLTARLKLNDEVIWKELVDVDLSELKQEKDMKVRIIVIFGALENLRIKIEQNLAFIRINDKILVALSFFSTITLLLLPFVLYGVRKMSKDIDHMKRKVNNYQQLVEENIEMEIRGQRRTETDV
jgi:hypothetical protein